MRRALSVVVLLGFLVFTGVFLFVYLFRAFRLPEPSADLTVYVWHGDPMIRAVLVAVLFLIGLVLMLFVSIATNAARRSGTIRIRSDLWDWLDKRAEETNEDRDQIAERAIAQYRDETETGPRRGSA